MCLICIEFYHQRMTRDELRKALPEMVMFAKNDEERNHFKKLQSIESTDELLIETQNHINNAISINGQKNTKKNY